MSVAHASRVRPFGLLWVASTISALGDGVHWIALPLLAASVTTDPRLVSLVSVAEQLPWVLFGLLAGALADRVDRRRVLWRLDVVRAAVVAVLAATVLTGTVTLPVVLVVAFALTSVGTLYDSASAAMVPALVPEAQRPAANGRLQAGMLVADTLLGAPVGATLFTALAAAPFLVDAASFAAAAILVAAIPVRAAPPATRAAGTVRADVVAGLRFLLGHRLLRRLCAYGALLNLVTTVAVALLVLYTRGVLHLGSLGYGLLVAAFAVGGVLGSLTAGRIAAAVGSRTVLLAAVAVGGAGATGMALATHPVPAGIAVGVFGAANGLWSVVAVSTRQSLVPDRMLGRVSSAFRLVTLGAGPLGALAAGFVAHRYGLRAPIAGAATLLVLGAVLAPALFTRADLPARRP
ncbi:MFS transporter [Actinocatenispora rupis]|uniref:MFS transporter n=1 Tax=Actinocatenispora rupis TaxID=519421 RepID=A0A8J3J4F0_9ACTN|nr:MFS transporter [Actinocatenispora rupis]GID14490.1 MFS transporter [Actinocatenispora rupis]